MNSLPCTGGRALRRGAARRWFLAGQQGWWPRAYEWFFTRTRWGRSLRESEAQTIVRALRAAGVAGRRVLEIGAGTGAYTDLLERTGALVEVREPSPTMRSYLQARARDRRWRSVTIGDGTLPSDLRVSSTFDVVLAIGVLNYVAELRPALLTLARALAPDGVLIVNVPTADRPAGTRYRMVELLGRRRVFCRARAEVETAAEAAGLRPTAVPRIAGVTDLYVMRALEQPGAACLGDAPLPHPQ